MLRNAASNARCEAVDFRRASRAGPESSERRCTCVLFLAECGGAPQVEFELLLGDAALHASFLWTHCHFLWAISMQLSKAWSVRRKLRFPSAALSR